MTDLDNKEPRAMKLWGEILKTRLETGEPYIMFEDNVNNANPEAYKKNNLHVSMTNICSNNETKCGSHVCIGGIVKKPSCIRCQICECCSS